MQVILYQYIMDINSELLGLFSVTGHQPKFK